MPATGTPDPLGAGYWRLTRVQQEIAAALTDDFRPLREVIMRRNNDIGRNDGGQVRWEKLNVLKILAVDLTRRDNVYVRRGENWLKWWDKAGADITDRQVFFSELTIDLAI